MRMGKRTRHQRSRFAVLTEDSGVTLGSMTLEEEFEQVDRLVRGYMTACFTRDEGEKERIWEELSNFGPPDITIGYMLGTAFPLVQYVMSSYTGVDDQAGLLNLWSDLSFQIEEELMIGFPEDDS